jgi:hypothetical protein
MCLVATTEGAISAKRIQRETGVTYKTAWRMLSRLREFIADRQTHSAQAMKENDVLVLPG